MPDETNGKSSDQTRENLLKQEKRDPLLSDAAAREPPFNTSILMSRAVVDTRFAAAATLSTRANAMQTLQQRHGNAYVQRLVDRSSAATLSRPAPHPHLRPIAPPPIQLQPVEDAEMEAAPAVADSALGFATPPAAPPAPPDAPGAGQPGAGAPSLPPIEPGSAPAPPPAAQGSATPPPASAAAGNNGIHPESGAMGAAGNGNGHGHVAADRGHEGVSVQRVTIGPDNAREKHGSTGAGVSGPDPAQPPSASDAAAGPTPEGDAAVGPQGAAPAPEAGVQSAAPESADAGSEGASTPESASAATSAAGSQNATAPGAQAQQGATPSAGAAGAAAGNASQAGAAPGAAEQAATAAPGEQAAAAAPFSLDEDTAALLADFAASFGSRAGDITGPAAKLLSPEIRQAAARLVPDRAEDLGDAHIQRSPAPEQPGGIHLQRTPSIQREGKGTGTLPTQKVKVTLPNWPKTPLFKDRNLGSWFLLSGEVESPTWEGEAKPPDSLRDDTKEEELQLTADGKVKGYSATFYKETLGKAGPAEIEGSVAVETTDRSVKVSGISVKLPDLGGESVVLLQGQVDFSILEWEKGEPPALMVLSYTQKVGIKSSFQEDGWNFTGSLYLPVKFSIKPNPAKLAEYIARVIGPRLAVAAPAGLAIAAPLVAGGVCLMLWINAVRAGEDMATAMDYAKENTIGYVSSYFNTIMGYDYERYSNQGSAAGKTAAQKVLDGLRWSELPAGAQEKIRAEYINEGTLNMPSVQAAIWSSYRSQAIEWYRKEHDWDAWAYDKGLPSDLSKLHRNLDIVGPPWGVSAY